MGTRLLRGPRQAAMAMLDGMRHQRVIRGVIVHQVDAVAEAVVRLELWQVFVGEEAGG